MVNNIKSTLSDAKEKCTRQQAIASKLTDNKKPSDARDFPYKKQFDELPDTMDELVDHMNELQGQMECVRNYNPEVCFVYFIKWFIKILKWFLNYKFQVITEYENLIRDIERIKGAIEAAKSRQNNLDTEMDTIFVKWSAIILKVVTKINEKFSNFMELMGFAGEVQLICPNEVLLSNCNFTITKIF